MKAMTQWVFCSGTGEIYCIEQQTEQLLAYQKYQRHLSTMFDDVDLETEAMQAQDRLQVSKMQVARGLQDQAKERVEESFGDQHFVYLKERADRIYEIEQQPHHAMADDVMKDLGFDKEDYIYLDIEAQRERFLELDRTPERRRPKPDHGLQLQTDREKIAAVMYRAERIYGDDDGPEVDYE